MPPLGSLLMQNEREFLRRVSGATPDALLDAITAADGDEERVLRIYLGDEQFAALKSLASAMCGPAPAPRGNVVVLPGIMGSELSLRDGNDLDLLWFILARLFLGKFLLLGMDASGGNLQNIQASGLFLRFYGQQLVSLRLDGWNVLPFVYDWRND